jgi:hypothetical protein
MALSEERLEHIRCTLDALDEDVHGICTLRTIWWRDAMADLLSERDRLAAEVERLRALDAAMAAAWVHGCGSGCCHDYACALACQRCGIILERSGCIGHTDDSPDAGVCWACREETQHVAG